MYVAYLGIIRFDQRGSKEWEGKEWSEIRLTWIGGGRKTESRPDNRPSEFIDGHQDVRVYASGHRGPIN